ncbi:hypothetical protein HDU85_003606 [Gaertneriomyces sp. JEL0708]|nr:hypothetical protein HDU85_003606 [Gaertneriomyces sp. JEL0708]
MADRTDPAANPPDPSTRARTRRRASLNALSMPIRRVRAWFGSLNGNRHVPTDPTDPTAAAAAATTPPRGPPGPVPMIDTTVAPPDFPEVVSPRSRYWPNVCPAPVAASDPAALALRDSAHHVIRLFMEANIPVDPFAITRTIQRIVPDPSMWEDLRTFVNSRSWSVASDIVQDIFNLQDASEASPDYDLPLDIRTQYLRSIALDISDVCLLMDRFKQKYHHPMFVGKMEKLLSETSDEVDTQVRPGGAVSHRNRTVYLRYVGSVVGPRTPYDRWVEDTRTSREGRPFTLIGKVSLCIEELKAEGEIIAEHPHWVVEEFVLTRAPARLEEEDLMVTEYAERVLIALFDRDALLNVQHGGFYAAFELQDQGLFRTLRTSVKRSLQALAIDMPVPLQLPATQTTTDVTEHFQTVFEFMRMHPVLMGYMPLYDNYQDYVIRQAIPRTRQVAGATLVVMVGKDVTYEDLTFDTGDCRFLHGVSRAGHVLRTILLQLLEWEGDFTRADVKRILECFPFVDLFPWPLLHHLLQAEEFLSAYLRSVRPWVTIAFSQKVSKILANGFQLFGPLTRDVGGSTFVDLVGTIHVASFDDQWLNDENQAEPADASYSIVICHYDPGRHKYGEQHPTLIRLLVLTWFATFVLIDETSTYLSTPRTHTRRQSCEEIRTRVLTRLQESGFDDVFNAAKDEYRLYYANSPGNLSTLARTGKRLADEARQRRYTRYQVTRALRHAQFVAQGRPDSAERQAQVDRLWQLRRPELGFYIPYTEEQRWRTWMLTRGEGVSLITAALSAYTTQIGDGPRGVFIRSLGLPVRDTDPVALEQAIRERLETLRQHRNESPAFRRAQRARALAVWNRQPDQVVTTLQGTPVNVLENRRVSFLSWLDSDGQEGRSARVVLRVPPNVLLSPTPPRLSFEEDGVHLLYNGDYFAVRWQDMYTLHTYGAPMRAIWLRERARITGTDVAELERRYRSPVGDMNLPKSSLRGTPQIRRVRREDAIWLFCSWLDEEYPDPENTIRHHWDDPENPFTTRFLPWIDANYPIHPHRDGWFALLNMAEKRASEWRETTKIVTGCIAALRGILETTGRAAQFSFVPADGKRRTGRILRFPGPGLEVISE